MIYSEIIDEFETIKRLKNGSEEAFNAIYNTYKQRMFFFARRFVDHQAEAEDITAEAFIKLWSQKGNFDTINAVIVYLHKTIKNRCLDYLKHETVKRNHHPQLVRIIENTEDSDLFIESTRLELLKKVFEVVEQLPPRLKEVFLLSYRDGLKPAQIAEKLGSQVQTVKNQRIHAIRLLKDAFVNHPSLLAFLALLEMETYWPR